MKRASTVISIVAAIIVFAFPQGCAALGSKELTRQRALAIIRGHKDFKSPVVLPVRDVEKFNVPATSEDEEPVPYDRAVERYFENYPEMGALRALGLVEAEATLRDKPQMLPTTRRLLDWRFSIDARLTAKGREVVRAAGGSGEESVPLFRREVLEVTGLRKESATSMQADFTWKAVATPVGEAFNPNSATFRNMPEGLRQKISRPTIHGDTLKLEFGDVRRGTAHFELYNDGWRVSRIVR
jgi:hypothetical protein